jgi:hypothetical protein
MLEMQHIVRRKFGPRSVIRTDRRTDDLMMRLVLLSGLVTALPAFSQGSDAIIGAIPDVSRYGSQVVDGTTVGAYSFGSTWCNIGSTQINNVAQSSQHPLFATSVFRVEDGAIVQIGMSWNYYADCALQQTLCGTCQPAGSGCQSWLGIGCSDPNTAGIQAVQSNLGPRSRVNVSTGSFAADTSKERSSWPAIPSGGQVTARRVQVPLSELNPNLHPNAFYVAEGMVISPDDALAGNDNNNASYRPFTVGSLTSGTYTLTLTGATFQQKPAIMSWPVAAPGAVVTPIDGPDGRYYVGSNVVELGNGQYRYWYAIYNQNSDAAAASFELGIDGPTTDHYFRDIPFHSGEVWNSLDWSFEPTPSGVRWRCQETFAQNPNANAIRYGTLYAFGFTSNIAPSATYARISLFKSGEILEVPIRAPARCTVITGSPADCNGNGRADLCDIEDGASADVDQNGVPDSCQPDCNANDLPDAYEISTGLVPDCNGNSVPDACDLASGQSGDCNRNGRPDSCDVAGGTSNDVDTDGVPDECRPDCNGNGLPDAYETGAGLAPDCNGNAIPDSCEDGTRTATTGNMGRIGPSDSASGSLPNVVTSSTAVALTLEAIADLGAVTEYCSIELGGVTVASLLFQATGTDCPQQPNRVTISVPAAAWNEIVTATGSAIPVVVRGSPLVDPLQCSDPLCRVSVTYGDASFDCDLDGVSDLCQIANDTVPDCNRNGRPDSCDVASGQSTDLDGNGVPDSCQPDCNANQVPDSYEVGSGLVPDCNTNLIPDSCDVAGGAPDCNANAIPDACDIAGGASNDCNGNEKPDSCDIASGAAPDCNGNGVPDSCDVASGTGADCDGNGQPDSCQLSGGGTPDCNGNGVLDSCDIASGQSADVDRNGIPDSCQTDCNGNGIPDQYETASGTSPDCNSNQTPDSCDIASGSARDCNSNGIPDSCDIASGAIDKDADGRIDDCEYALGDFDLDGAISGSDLGVLLAVWGLPNPLFGDLDGNGSVNGGDLGLLLSRWGPLDP